MDIKLAPHIIDAIEKEAIHLGVSVEELIRMELGHRFGSVTRLMSIGPSMSSAGPVSVSPPIAPTLDPNIVRQIQAASAVLGQLKCFECTQSLSIRDVREGVCSHCGAALPT